MGFNDKLQPGENENILLKVGPFSYATLSAATFLCLQLCAMLQFENKKKVSSCLCLARARDDYG